MSFCFSRYLCLLSLALVGVFIFPPISTADKTKDLFIVDCLLPGQVRRLGNSSYITPRRPAQIPASECRIQGGEYVEYDRADYRTSLKVWIQSAKSGNVEAQTNVGEIYEKGLGIKPNYPLAAEWYQRAAEQGYSPAQINLGYLYEKGLGVEQDSVQALNWYRRASGLKDAIALDTGSIRFSSGSRTVVPVPIKTAQNNKSSPLASEDNSEVVRLKKQLEEHQAELKRLIAQNQNQAKALSLKTQAQQTNTPSSPVAISGPMIKMIDPPLGGLRTRGFEVVEVSPSVRQREIIGRLADPANLLSFTVNDRTESVGEDGLFRATVTLRDARTPIKIVAIDKDGERRSIEFQLKPKEFEAAKKVKPSLNFGNYHALLIGNQKHTDWPDLQTPENDVRVAAKILSEQYGFKTEIMLDASRFDIMQALNEYRKKLTKNDNFLLYYAGHGHYEEEIKRGYWVPTDGHTDSNVNWVPTFAITDTISAMSAKHILVVSDSCYSGALTRSGVAARLEAGRTEEAEIHRLTVISKKTARTVLTSGDLQPVLDQGSNNHSLFAKAFLDVLRNNTEVLEGMSVWLEIRELVLYAAAGANIEQDPQYAPLRYSGHSGGDFLFVPKGLQ
jgi:hypothetical protein